MKQRIKIRRGDEFMDYSGDLKLIRVLDKHFDDYYVESFAPTYNEETETETWDSVGKYVMSAHDLTEIVREEKNMSDICLVFEKEE